VTLTRKWMPSPNYSSRGSAVRLIVLHTAEGALTIESLGSFFSASSAGVSSHVGIDDTPGTVGEYVRRDFKAWTQGNANPYSDAAELCAFAAWSPADWAAHPVMLDNCAQWIAEEAATFGIPLVRLSAAQAQDGRSAGVCQHVDLGAAGGGHWDCGPSFPMDQVLAAAQGGTIKPSSKERRSMVLTDEVTSGMWVLNEDGGVYTYDGAPYLGGTNNARANPAGYPVYGIAAYGSGYVIVLDWGDDGNGHAPIDGGDRFRRYHFRRDGSGIVA
jgi:hypothetical protein